MRNSKLFILDRQRDEGVIVEAEIRRSQHNGEKYIWVTLNMGGADQAVVTVLGRVEYTSYVIRHGLGEEEEDEEANVASLKGQLATVRWEHRAILDRQPFPQLRIRGVGL